MSNLTENYRYKLNDKPSFLEGVVLGFQHVCVMMAGLLSVPLTFASALSAAGMNVDASYMIQCALFASGVTTIIQSLGIWRIGSRLPISMGVSMIFITPGIMIATKWGMASLITAFIICGIIEAFLGAFLSRTLKALIPPLIAGAVVTCMGVLLFGMAITYCGGGFDSENYASLLNLGLAFLTLVIIILLNRFSKGFINAASVLIGIAICYVISAAMGKIDFTPVAQASWFSVPKPLAFGLEINLNAIAIVFVLYIVSLMDFAGTTTAVAKMAAGREPTDNEFRGGIICDGLGSAFSALFNSLPNVSYGNCVGLIGITGVASRFIMAFCGGILVLISFIPKISAALSIVPPAVLGGSMLVLFGMVATAGLDILRSVKFTQRNMLILGVAFAVGIGFSYDSSGLVNLPYLVQLLISGGPGTALVAIILNFVLPKDEEGTIPS